MFTICGMNGQLLLSTILKCINYKIREVENLSKVTQLLCSKAVAGIQISWFDECHEKLDNVCQLVQVILLTCTFFPLCHHSPHMHVSLPKDTKKNLCFLTQCIAIIFIEISKQKPG